jgi:glutamate-1-semialdehyde 2,1-aminomutase
LNPVGVPKELSGISSPFSFGDLEKLRDYLQTGEYAAVIMEVYRNVEPSVEYLREVRELCDKHGAVLIFDECTSGFRENLGGLHLKYGVNPDLATLSKALGNGYAISSVLVVKNLWLQESTHL